MHRRFTVLPFTIAAALAACSGSSIERPLEAVDAAAPDDVGTAIEPGVPFDPDVPEEVAPPAAVVDAAVPDAAVLDAAVPPTVTDAAVPPTETVLDAGVPDAAVPPTEPVPPVEAPTPDTPQRIEAHGGGTYYSSVAVDPDGNATVVWDEYEGSAGDIWANRMVAGAGWGTPVRIETDNAGEAKKPRVAVDAAGNATAVWAQSDGTRWNAWTNRFVPGTGWGGAQRLETDDAGSVDGYSVQIAVGAAGDAVAIWRQSDGLAMNLWANRFVPGTGWAGAQLLETLDTVVKWPRVAIDVAGNATVVWSQRVGFLDYLWATRFVPGASWSPAARVEPAATGYAEEPRLAVDPAGNVVVVWSRCNNLGTACSVHSSRFVLGAGWEPTVELDAEGRRATVVVDDAGNAIAIWHRYDASGWQPVHHFISRRFVPGLGWGPAREIFQGDQESWPVLGVDAAGNVTVVWSTLGAHAFAIKRYVPDAGWGPTRFVSGGLDGGLVPVYFPELAVAPAGEAVIVWASLADLWAVVVP